MFEENISFRVARFHETQNDESIISYISLKEGLRGKSVSNPLSDEKVSVYNKIETMLILIAVLENNPLCTVQESEAAK